MAQWAVIIPAGRWATERLFHHDTVTVPFGGGVEGGLPRVSDDVPRVEGDVRRVSDEAPRVDGGLPRVSDDVPRVEGDVRRVSDEVPRVDGGLPRVDGDVPRVADEVLLVVDGGVVALAQVVGVAGGALELAYVRRAFDEPVPAAGLVGGDGLQPVDPAAFHRVAGALGDGPDRHGLAGKRSWLVSVALPIEAVTPAEAVRQFWSHVRQLGPAELPAYVWPSGDELAMQAFVLGEEANQDPEEDDES